MEKNESVTIIVSTKNIGIKIEQALTADATHFQITKDEIVFLKNRIKLDAIYLDITHTRSSGRCEFDGEINFNKWYKLMKIMQFVCEHPATITIVNSNDYGCDFHINYLAVA